MILNLVSREDLSTKAGKSTNKDIIVYASNWRGSNPPYENAIDIKGITEKGNVELTVKESLSIEESESYSAACIYTAKQEKDKLILLAYGEKPSLDLPMTVVIRRDASYSDLGEDDVLLDKKEDRKNKVTRITPNSTHVEYPTAKAVYDMMSGVSENITIFANKWTGNSAPYSNIVDVDIVTANSITEITAPGNLTMSQLNAFKKSKIDTAIQSKGKLEFRAYGEKPTVDLPAVVVVKGEAAGAVEVIRPSLFVTGLKQTDTCVAYEGDYDINVNSEEVSRDGLVAEYLFDGNVNDTSGNGNDLTADSGVTFSDSTSAFSGSANSTAGVFSGSTGYVQASSGVIPTNSPFSISLWVKTTKTDNAYFLETTNTTVSQGVKFYCSSSKVYCEIRTSSSYTQLKSRTTISDGLWHHIVYTHGLAPGDGNTKLYVDGALEASEANGGNLSSSTFNLLLGNDYQKKAAYSLDGSLDNIRIYDRVLSEDEIIKLYNELSIPLIPTMTSNTDPSGYVASAGSSYKTSAYEAFVPGTTSYWLSDSKNKWLTIHLPEAKKANSLMLKSSNAYLITGFTLKGSVDGSSWTDIKTFNIASGSVNYYEDFYTDTAYSYYQVYVNSVSGSDNMALIYEFQLYYKGSVNYTEIPEGTKKYIGEWKTRTISEDSDDGDKNPLAEGLLAEYLFDGNVDDTSGNGNNLINKGVTFDDGVGVFDGSAYAVASSGVIEPGKSFSLSFWLKKSNTYDAQLFVNTTGINSSTSYGIKVSANSDSKIEAWGYFGGDGTYNIKSFTSTKNISTSGTVWNHIVFIMDKESMTAKYYIDGEPAGSTSISHGMFPMFDKNLTIGGDRNLLTGSLNNIRIYDRTLSEDEIIKLYNELPRPLLPEDGGTITASSQFNTLYAENVLIDGESTLWGSSGDFPQWIKYEFKTPKKISVCALSGIGNTQGLITSALLQWSDDGEEWSNGARLNLDWTSDSTYQTVSTNIAESDAHKYWRLYIESALASSTSVKMNLHRWNLYGVDMEDKAASENTISGFAFPNLEKTGMYTVVANRGLNTACRKILVDLPTEYSLDMDFIPNKNLIAEYLLDEDGSDTSSHGNDLTINGVTFENNAAVFNGSAYAEASAKVLPSENKVTISFWMKTSTNGKPIFDTLYSAASANNRQGYSLNIDQDKVQFIVYATGDSGDSLYSASAIVDNTWHHIALVQDSATLSIYIDGVLDATKTTSVLPSGNYGNLVIGRCVNGVAGAGATTYYTGSLDNIRIYDRVLTEVEIGQLAGEVHQRVYLYKEGNECVDITGGWSKDGYNYGSSMINSEATKTEYSLKVSSSGDLIGTVKAIDFTKYNTLCIDRSGGYNTQPFMRISSSKNIADDDIAMEEHTKTGSRYIHTFDISSINKEAYVLFGGINGTAYKDHYGYFYNVWLE